MRKPKPQSKYKAILLKRERADALLALFASVGLRLKRGPSGETGIGFDALLMLAAQLPTNFGTCIVQARGNATQPAAASHRGGPKRKRQGVTQ